MTNGEKYTTAKERKVAFLKFCKRYKYCHNCPVYQPENEVSCRFGWLDLEAPMTAKETADILERYNNWRRNGLEALELIQALERAVKILRNVKE